jgi:hypothetical protein
MSDFASPNGEGCKHCIYSKSTGYRAWECRRHAPVFVAPDPHRLPSGGATWPPVHESDYCGDFLIDYRRMGT